MCLQHPYLGGGALQHDAAQSESLIFLWHLLATLVATRRCRRPQKFQSPGAFNIQDLPPRKRHTWMGRRHPGRGERGLFLLWGPAHPPQPPTPPAGFRNSEFSGWTLPSYGTSIRLSWVQVYAAFCGLGAGTSDPRISHIVGKIWEKKTAA